MAADRELPEDELEQLHRHLAECSACQARFNNHGELDMLLKSHLSHEPPEAYFETLWPSVSERLEEGDASGGGDDAVVFKSSPAMDYLNIPERKPERKVREGDMESAAEPTAPPSEASPWRWPLALMVSTAIAVVGYLAYKKMSPPPPEQPVVAAAEPTADEPAPAAASQPASEEPAAEDAGMQVASLAGGDAGTTSVDDPSEAQRHKARPRRRRHRSKGKRAESPKPVVAAPAPKPKPKPGKPQKPKKPGKPSSLDTLLDDAIGGKEPSKKKAAPAAAPKPAASDLPEQLNMNQIRSAMNRVKGRVQACYDQFQVEGMANVGFVIKGSGTINKVSIRGKFRGTDTGDCVVKAVKTASFPKFSGKPMTIKNYPFLLQ
jgi:hypothetical protein